MPGVHSSIGSESNIILDLIQTYILLIGGLDVFPIDPSAAVVYQDCPEAELKGVKGRGGYTDVSSNTTDVNICAALRSDKRLQLSLTHFCVIEEG